MSKFKIYNHNHHWYIALSETYEELEAKYQASEDKLEVWQEIKRRRAKRVLNVPSYSNISYLVEGEWVDVKVGRFNASHNRRVLKEFAIKTSQKKNLW